MYSDEKTREEYIDDIINLTSNGKKSLIQKRYDLADKYFDDIKETVQLLEEAVGELHL
tara:strand:- start:1884 stop:2057 length:174 start_codon:yes stop_codon:yes gene_type:complete